MKKGKILAVGLIGLLLASGLVLFGCGAVKCYGSCGKIAASCSSICMGAQSSSDSLNKSKVCDNACK